MPIEEENHDTENVPDEENEKYIVEDDEEINTDEPTDEELDKIDDGNLEGDEI